MRAWAEAHRCQSPLARLVLELLDEIESSERLSRTSGRPCSIETFQLGVLADDGCPLE